MPKKTQPETGTETTTAINWQDEADKLRQFIDVWEDHWHNKIDNKEYVLQMRKDTTNDLLVEYTGSHPALQHRMMDATSKRSNIVFGGNAGPVTIVNPAEKFRYIRNAIANPDVWRVAWSDKKTQFNLEGVVIEE